MGISRRALVAVAAVGIATAGLTAVATAKPQAERFAQTHCYPARQGVHKVEWNGAPVSASQPVAVSVSEGFMHGEGLGEARMWVENVTVVNSAIHVRVVVNWGQPLPYCLHYVG